LPSNQREEIVMGIMAAQCGEDICKSIALLDKWKVWAHIDQGILDYLHVIAVSAIGKEGVEHELKRRSVKVE